MNVQLIFKELHVVIESVKFIIANMSMKNHIGTSVKKKSRYEHFKIDQQKHLTISQKLHKFFLLKNTIKYYQGVIKNFCLLSSR